MTDFSLHLRQSPVSDEWGFIVRDHTGTARYARRFFPDRLTAERSGKGAMRQLKAEQAGVPKPRAKREPAPVAKPKWRLFLTRSIQLVFAARPAPPERAANAQPIQAAANDNPGRPGAPVPWKVGLPVIRQHLARGLTLRDALRAADESLQLAGGKAQPSAGPISKSLYEWYGKALSAESKTVKYG